MLGSFKGEVAREKENEESCSLVGRSARRRDSVVSAFGEKALDNG
jgi:hypothetical protein